MVKTHGRKVAGSFGAGGNGEVVDAFELLLLRVLVIGEEEKLVFLDRSADGCALLITVEIRGGVALSAAQLSLLVEVFVGSENVGPEYAEDIAVKLIRAGLADQADDTRGAALIRGRCILGFDSNFFNAILWNIHRRNDGGGIVFSDADGAAIKHVVDRANDGAVDGGRGDIDTGTADRDVLNRDARIARVGRAVGRGHSRTQLHEIVNIAVEQGDAVDGG